MICVWRRLARKATTLRGKLLRDYRSYMVSVARTMTQDAGAAEQLADSTFAELYGLRESGGARSASFVLLGRGSLRGWLARSSFSCRPIIIVSPAGCSDRRAGGYGSPRSRREKPERRTTTDLDYVRDRYAMRW